MLHSADAAPELCKCLFRQTLFVTRFHNLRCGLIMRPQCLEFSLHFRVFKKTGFNILPILHWANLLK